MQKNSDRGLWLAVLGGFGLLAAAWTMMFFVATRHPVQTVPLTSAPAGPSAAVAPSP